MEIVIFDHADALQPVRVIASIINSDPVLAGTKLIVEPGSLPQQDQDWLEAERETRRTSRDNQRLRNDENEAWLEELPCGACEEGRPF
jgi:hypothetical protein